MGGSILSRQDRLPLENGMSLRLISGYELLQARREARVLAEHPQEQPLCSNACLVARALETQGGKLLFLDGKQVLQTLTAEEIENLACLWDRFRRGVQPGGQEEMECGVNPNFDEGKFAGREEDQQ